MSDTASPTTQAALAAALESAASGGKSQLLHFFTLLRSAKLFVPTRQQERQIHNTPAYPDEFLNVLAIEEQERIFVPCFSDQVAIKEWYAGSLNVREIEFSAVCSLLPQDWWLVLNPASDACKELSPWELQQLRGDQHALAELIDELKQSDIGAPIRIEALASDQAMPLQQALINWGRDHAGVTELYLAREFSSDYSQPLEQLDAQLGQTSTLLIGVAIAAAHSNRLDQISSAATNVAAQAMIGDETPRVLCGAYGSVALGVFKGIEPIYKAKGGILNYLIGKIKLKSG